MKLNWLDIIIILPLVFGLVRGVMRGFVSEIIAIVVVVLGVIGSRLAAPACSAWLLKQFAWPANVCDVVAYVAIFLVIAVILSILAKLLSKFLKAIHLGWANRLLGGLFGLCKYAILVLIVVFVLDKTNATFHWLDESQIVKTSLVYPQAVKAVHYCTHLIGVSS
jgi:membrane protein required for colicin V production